MGTTIELHLTTSHYRSKNCYAGGGAFQGYVDVNIDFVFVTQPSTALLQHPLTPYTPPPHCLLELL